MTTTKAKAQSRWRVQRPKATDKKLLIVDRDGLEVAALDYDDVDHKGVMADARKMASSPELLAACRIALGTLMLCRDDLAASGNGGADDDEICEEAKALTPAIVVLRKAIAKADPN
jgi:hypothetical protein